MTHDEWGEAVRCVICGDIYAVCDMWLHCRDLAGYQGIFARRANHILTVITTGELLLQRCDGVDSRPFVSYVADFGQRIVEPQAITHLPAVPKTAIEEIALEPRIGASRLR